MVPKRDAAQRKTQLSDFELEVLQLLWQRERASTPELHAAILEQRDVSYSTVRTIVHRLEEKGAIARVSQSGRAITFRPILRHKHMSKSLVRRLIDRVFAGDPRSLFSHLLEHESLDSEDLSYIEALLAEKKRKLGRRQS